MGTLRRRGMDVDCGFEATDSDWPVREGIRNPHSAIRNGLRAKPALGPLWFSLVRAEVADDSGERLFLQPVMYRRRRHQPEC